MNIFLQMNGRTVSFSQEELLSKLERLKKLEDHFSVDTENKKVKYGETTRPTDGKYFKINPSKINDALFMQKRPDFMQEWTRKTIMQALNEIKGRNGKYSKPFATYMPIKSWKSKTTSELEEFAQINGDHITNWVEQSLEWAQRITNGEAWETLCNHPDTANWYRLVLWKNNNFKIVGGSHNCGDSLPSVTVFGNNSSPNDILHFTIPLITIYL